MLVSCHHCGNTIRATLSGRARMVMKYEFPFCNIECLEEYEEDERRLRVSQAPLPFDYVGANDE
jgi:hypothetical protein